ncbi:MAG: DUF6020 family protein, partial [Mucispirillum sp.]|nr:DUF6020 family protein [Mucispirillum sp.]
SIIMGLYFAFTSVFGAYYEGASKGERYAEVLDFTLNQFIISLKYIPALLFLFFSAVLFIFIQIPKLYNNYISSQENYTEMPKMFNKLHKIWFFIFICWLPYFILLYPGYVFWDAKWQIEQLFSGRFNSHHPLFTTLYMYFIYFFYKISNNGLLSIALYVVIFQMIPLSFIYAYMINKLNKIYNVNKMIVVLLILFAVLYPANPMISISIEKSILFLIFLILFIIKIIEISENVSLLHHKKHIIFLIITGIILCLTRNNVVYGFILAIPFILFFAKGHRKYILISFAGIFIGYVLLNTALIKVTHAEKGEFRESMSMPLQQLARVYKYHKKELSKDEIIFISKAVYNNNALNNYVPKWADLVKIGADSKFLKTKEFITGYINLGLKYPGTYLNSFLIMTSALWNPFENVFFMEALPIVMRDIKYINIKYDDFFKYKNKVVSDYLLKTQMRVKKNNSMASFVLFNQSFLFYTFIFIFIYFALNKLYQYNFIIIILLCYAATLLLEPIINFRYTYFFAALIPMLIMMVTNRNNRKITI